MDRRTTRSFGVVLAAGLVAATTGSAHGAVVSGSGGSTSYEGARGQATRLTVTARSGGELALRDEAQPMQASGTCRAVGAEVHCPRAPTLRVTTSTQDDRVTIDATVKAVTTLNEGNDQLLGSQGPDGAAGGPGADVLEGRGGDDGQDVDPRTGTGSSEGLFSGELGPDVVDGGPGDDKLLGDQHFRPPYGADEVRGGPGDDVLDGDGGPDVMSGGDGRDLVTYAASAFISDRPRPLPVTANLDGEANDGAPGENDRIAADVEDLVGGAGADRLTGNDGPNRLAGGDAVDCQGDEEIFCASPGPADVLEGGGGNDRLDGGDSGRDRLVGGEGDDVLNGQESPLNVDARDTLACEGGTDTVYLGNTGYRVFDRAGDQVGADCELRRRAGAQPVASFTAPRVARRVGRSLHVRVRCPLDRTRFEPESCQLGLRASAAGTRRRLSGLGFHDLRPGVHVVRLGLIRGGLSGAVPGKRVRVELHTFLKRGRLRVRSATMVVRR